MGKFDINVDGFIKISPKYTAIQISLSELIRYFKNSTNIALQITVKVVISFI